MVKHNADWWTAKPKLALGPDYHTFLLFYPTTFLLRRLWHSVPQRCEGYALENVRIRHKNLFLGCVTISRIQYLPCIFRYFMRILLPFLISKTISCLIIKQYLDAIVHFDFHGVNPWSTEGKRLFNPSATWRLLQRNPKGHRQWNFIGNQTPHESLLIISQWSTVFGIKFEERARDFLFESITN